ncbi:MAG TPA: ion channel [Pseudolysinimonas sp.]|nr:ion channel [Pseudolysinimonas sp.]
MTPELWRKYSEWPLAIAAVVFLVAYSIEVIADVPDRNAAVFDIIIWATWGLFVVDYVANLILAEHKLQWFTHNLHAAVILALPMMRPLRLMRLVSVLQFSHRVGGRRLRGRILTYAFAISILLVYVGALAVLDAEQNVPGASITNIGDALWWAAVTLTGTGYGDFVPITVIGRLVAVGLMIGGLAIVGVIAASFATWMIERFGTRVAEEAEVAESETQSEVAVLAEQVARLTALVEARLPAAPGTRSPTADPDQL